MDFKRLKRKIYLHCKGIVYQSRLRQYRKTKDTLLKKFRVLIMMNEGGIGNAIAVTPFVQAVRMLWPAAEITILIPPGDMFENWVIPDTITSTIEDIKGKSFDHTFFPYWIWRGLPGWSDSCDLGLTHYPKIWLEKMLLKPEGLYSLDMLKKFGYRGLAPPLYVSMKKPEIGLPAADLRICLAPGGKNETQWRHKRWPYYRELTDELLKGYPEAQICIIGTREDTIEGLLQDERRIIDLRGNLTLREAAWVFKNSDLAVGNDCGPMHIADAVQTHSVVIFGPTCELKNAYSNKAVTVSADVPCRPCQYGSLIETCREPECMTKLTPGIIMESVKKIVGYIEQA
jgi:ADP-heptose:LPS heptosyltransferase